MTEPHAAFTATFVKTVPVGGRRVVQFVFEVATEQATEALNKLGGFPTNMTDIWCAIVRLNPGMAAPSQDGDAEKASASGNSRPSISPDKRPVQQAALMCNKPDFRLFLEKTFLSLGTKCNTSDEAAELVRHWCDVRSRSEIIVGTPAADKWDRLMAKFAMWERGLA